MSSTTQREEFINQIEDVLLRYEVDLPFFATELYELFEALDNPYDTMQVFDQMHSNVAELYGDALSAKIMPELSAVHVKIPREPLGGLTYAQLETTLRNAKTIRRQPAGAANESQATTDMSCFLTYVRDNSPALTKTLKQLNRKSVSEINALLVEPKQVIYDYGTMVFTHRDEHQFWKINFLRSLAKSDHLVYVRNGRLHLSKRGAGWLEIDDAAKPETLFRSWCETADWAAWNDYYEDIAEIVHFEQLMLYQVILALDETFNLVEEASLDNVCATLCGVVNETDEYGRKPFHYTSYLIVTQPLIYFGLAQYAHQQNEEQMLAPKDFTLTEFGTWMLQSAMQGEWSWVKARKVCPDCQRLHL